MFYAQFVLSKKGPLAKIWLAAHWEKKLSKAQIYETSVEDAVQEILQPKVKIALRTTGHLLLGIVRIYSRKTKYLLADCNEAFLKIKMAFRPGQIELIDERHDAPKNAITLPEVCQDFEALPEFADLDLSQQLQFNQSRIDDITLKDDFLADQQPQADAFGGNDFGMDDFGEAAVGGAAAAMEDFGITDDDFAMADAVEFGRKNDSNASSAAMRLREMTPCVEGREAPGHAIFDDEDMVAAAGGEHDDDQHFDAAAAAAPNNQFTDTMEAMDVGGVAAGAPPPDDLALGATAGTLNDDAASVAADSSFALEPLADGALPERAVRHRRKRRLIVDEHKSISAEEMKMNIADYSDTLLENLDLAPPNRKFMRMKESGIVERLFHMPGSDFVRNKQLVKLYQSHLTFATRTGHHSQPTSADNSQTSSQMEASVAEVRRDLDLQEVIDDLQDITHLNSMEPGGGPHFDDALQDDFAGTILDMPIIPDADSPPPQDDVPQEEETSPHGGTERKKARKSQSERTILDADDDTAQEGDEDHRWTKRTQNVLNSIATKIKASAEEEILLSDLLTKGSTRKTAAQKFYTLLVLKKWQAIDLRQDEPYGDIHVSAGPEMDAAVGAAA